MAFLRLYLTILFDRFRNNEPDGFAFAPAGGPSVALPEGFFDIPGVLLAAEDEGRTEEPTERKKEKEREEGRVPKTAEIPGSLVAIGGLITLFLLSGSVLSGLAKIMKRYVGGFNSQPAITEAELMPMLTSLIWEVGLIVGPVFLIGMIMAIIGNISMVGLMFTLKPLKPDFSRIKLSFKNLAKRVLFSKQVAMNLIKTILKVGFMAVISYFIITADFLDIMKTGQVGVADALQSLGYLAFKLALVLTILLFLMAIPDYMFQRYEFIEGIKMTRQEVKEEHRETEGDPLIKQRQRQRAHELLQGNLGQTIQETDVVIANPVHYAVMLRYRKGQDEAPVVIGKGIDNFALRIRQMAEENGVPVYVHRPLARQLYESIKLNSVVPGEFFPVLVAIWNELGLTDEAAGPAGAA